MTKSTLIGLKTPFDSKHICHFHSLFTPYRHTVPSPILLVHKVAFSHNVPGNCLKYLYTEHSQGSPSQNFLDSTGFPNGTREDREKLTSTEIQSWPPSPGREPFSVHTLKPKHFGGRKAFKTSLTAGDPASEETKSGGTEFRRCLPVCRSPGFHL